MITIIALYDFIGSLNWLLVGCLVNLVTFIFDTGHLQLSICLVGLAASDVILSRTFALSP